MKVVEQTQISGQLVTVADTQAAIVAETQEAVVQSNCSQLAWLAGHSKAQKAVEVWAHSQTKARRLEHHS